MKRQDRITVYRAEDGWRWNYRARNGRILADGGQGYSRRADCIHSLTRVTGGTLVRVAGALRGGLIRDGLPNVPVVIEP